MKRHLKTAINKWEKASTWQAFGTEKVVDKKTLVECLISNQRWLESHCTELTLRGSAVLAFLR